MAANFTADPVAKLLIITTPPTAGVLELDVRRDLYSALKLDWLTDNELNKYRFPIAPLGGNPLTDALNLGNTYFLDYGWRIRPYEADHRLILNGNLFVREGGQVDVSTLGDFQVSVSQFLSNLVSLVDTGAVTPASYQAPDCAINLSVDALDLQVAAGPSEVALSVPGPYQVDPAEEHPEIAVEGPIKITLGC